MSRIRWPQVALAILVLLLLANGATNGLTRLRGGSQRQGPQPRVAAPQTVPQVAPQPPPAPVTQVAQVSQVAPPQAPQAPAPVQLEVQFRPGAGSSRRRPGRRSSG